MKVNSCLLYLFIIIFIFQTNAQDYYPLQIGNKWVYERGDQVGFDVYEIIDTTSINNRCYFKFENRSTLREELFYFYRRIDSLNQVVEPIYESDKEYIRYKLDVSQGTFWIQYPNQFTYRTTLEDTSGTVWTPIGDFYPCHYYTILIVELYTDFKEWLAPDIGLVRDESELQSRILTGAFIDGKLTGDTTITKIINEPILNQPSLFDLKQNYPNPFNSNTTITYSLHKNSISNISLIIYDLKGIEIVSLVDGNKSKGFYKVKWNGTDKFGREVSSGIYIYELRAGVYKESRKLLFMK